MPPRRKKWTEEEERTLIDKYGEMLADGTLAKMKTREKKFRPIAAQVNSLHHSRDPIAFPWQWTWKDASTKVQNMRHQYLLVKQKIKKTPISDTLHRDHHQQQQQQQGGDGDVDVVGMVVESGGDKDEEGGGGEEQFDWIEGLTHWPNFLRYKSVFGDHPLGGFSNGVVGNSNGMINRSFGLSLAGRSIEPVRYGQFGVSGSMGEDGCFGVGIDGGGEHGVLLGLGFEYDGEGGGGEEIEENVNNGNGIVNGNVNGHYRMKEDGDGVGEFDELDPTNLQLRKKKKKLKGLEKRTLVFLANQFAQLREREAQFEECEAMREQERRRREQIRLESEREHERKAEKREREREERDQKREKLMRERIRELEAMEKESVERERRWREEELRLEREWEERMDRRRLDWKNRINDMLNQHRVTMDQIQSRILHDQQNLTNQLLGILSQWTGHPTGLSDHTGAGNPYLSQMIQSLHHVNGIVHSENRVDGDHQDDQFIVDDE